MNKPLQAWIEGVGFCAPGLPDWASAEAVFKGADPYVASPTWLSPPDRLPPAERRRASRVVKLALALGLAAAENSDAHVSTLATVFTASGADGHNCDALCAQLATEDKHISPTRFHNSVHNAPAGYWGIATRSMAPCQVLCAYDASFGAGLLEALAQVQHDQVPVLLIAYDSEYPEPLFSKRPVPDCAGVAFVLSPARTARSRAHLLVRPTRDSAETLNHEALETLRQQTPALRALPLLRCLALGQSRAVCLDYLPPMQLEVSLSPC